MSKTQIPTNGIADDAVGNTKLDLSETYNFTAMPQKGAMVSLLQGVTLMESILNLQMEH